MSTVLDGEGRYCFICQGPLTKANQLSYMELAGMPVTFHTACGENLNDAIIDRRNRAVSVTRTSPVRETNPVHKGRESKRAVWDADTPTIDAPPLTDELTILLTKKFYERGYFDGRLDATESENEHE